MAQLLKSMKQVKYDGTICQLFLLSIETVMDIISTQSTFHKNWDKQMYPVYLVWGTNFTIDINSTHIHVLAMLLSLSPLPGVNRP